MFVYLENFRCFGGVHLIKLAPMTILVGDNSSGKTSFLSAVSTILNKNKFPFKNDFNTAPYELGDTENIVFTSTKSKRKFQSFSIGFEKIIDDKKVKSTSYYSYEDGQSCVSKYEFVYGNYSINIDLDQNNIKRGILKSEKYGTIEFNGSLADVSGSAMSRLSNCIINAYFEIKNDNVADGAGMMQEMFHILKISNATNKKVSSIAPIRTKPKRSYDKIIDEYDSEGNHIPLKYANFLKHEKNEKLKSELQTKLNSFGSDSGLFEKVSFSKGTGSAFELIIHKDGAKQNLIDVGYGVSQCLPIVLQTLFASDQEILLLQQPEVHLHPKAQAALGTFISGEIKEDISFVIETHSDYFIDRIRKEIAVGNIKKEMVKILYFEKNEGRTKAHDIYFDDNGNILNPPDSYRQFFFDEQISMLTRGI